MTIKQVENILRDFWLFFNPRLILKVRACALFSDGGKFATAYTNVRRAQKGYRPLISKSELRNRKFI